MPAIVEVKPVATNVCLICASLSPCAARLAASAAAKLASSNADCVILVLEINPELIA